MTPCPWCGCTNGQHEPLCLGGQTVAAPWEQAAELGRVRSRIGVAVLAFCRARPAGARFHMEELTAYVAQRFPGAPDSPGRILRDLRARGLVRYRVVDRAASLYQLAVDQHKEDIR